MEQWEGSVTGANLESTHDGSRDARHRSCEFDSASSTNTMLHFLKTAQQSLLDDILNVLLPSTTLLQLAILGGNFW